MTGRNRLLWADFVAKVILKRSRIVIHRGDAGILRDWTMMGRVNRDQGQLFYCFNLEETVPEDHQVRRIAEVVFGGSMPSWPPTILVSAAHRLILY